MTKKSIFIEVLVLLLALSMMAQGSSNSKASLNETSADIMWKAIPEMRSFPIPPPVKPFNPTESEKLENEKAFINMYRGHIEDLIKYREFGIKFWKKFPGDKRRFDWLLNAVGMVCYFKNIDQAAHDKFYETFTADLDNNRIKEWQKLYKVFRSDFLSSKDVTDKMKFQLSEQEFSERIATLYWDKGNSSKIDLDRIEKEMLQYSDYFFSKITKQEELDIRFWGEHTLTYIIPQLCANKSAFGLEYKDIKKFLAKMEKCKYPFLQQQAREKLSILALTDNIFQFKCNSVVDSLIDFSKLKGKYVLIDFWSLSCSSCIDKMPEIKKVYDENKSKGFEVISVCFNPITYKDKVLKVYDKVGADWPLAIIGGRDWYDSSSLGYKISQKFGFTNVPQLLLFDTCGKLVEYNNKLLARGEFEKTVKNTLLQTSTFASKSIPANTATPANYFISGRIDSLSSNLPVFLINNASLDTIATAITDKGNFSFKGYLLESPEWFSIRLRGLETWPSFIMENSKIYVTGNVYNWENAKVIGSKANDGYLKLLQIQKPYKDKIDSINKAVGSLVKELNDQMIQKKIDYIKGNPNIAYTAFLLAKSSSFTISEKEEAYDNLSDEVRKSNFGKQLAKNIQFVKESEHLGVGEIAPDFKLPTPKGDSISLSEIVSKGKLTLLDFWASWCIPCRKEMPKIKALYNEFKSQGLNIVSISLDGKLEEWKKAIEKEGMDWFNVSQLRGWDGDLNTLYKINMIPQSFLIDGNGKIIAARVQGDKAEAAVRSYFSQQKN